MRELMKYNPGFYQLREGQLERILKVIRDNKNAKKHGVVFFGDSITEMYDLDKHYSELKVKINSGVGGAISSELLMLVDEAVIKLEPKLVVMMIGINDLGNTVMYSPKEIAKNVKSIIDLIRGNLKDTKVLLMSTLPCVEALRSYKQVPGIRCNDLVEMIYSQYEEMIIDDKVTLVNTFEHFVDENKEALVDYYQDGLHLNELGYEKLTNIIKPIILKLLNE